jgi:hypothetical protein
MWCAAQMQTLTSSTDLTLVDFLLALGSAGEVQEYVALYLGTSPAAQQFAGEFITRKHRLGVQAATSQGNEFLGTQVGSAFPQPPPTRLLECRHRVASVAQPSDS